jgi:microcystin-dependent protein
MSEVYLGQIMLAGFGFAPKNFALCNGQIMAISQNQALFSLLGTTYGGNGQTTFALPDLRGRTPVAFGQSADPNWNPSPYPLGQTGGVENVTLLGPNLPPHNHILNGTTSAGTQRNPRNGLYGTTTSPIYGPASGTQVPLNPQTIAMDGGTQPHSNMQPYRAVTFCIALSGIFPSRN